MTQTTYFVVQPYERTPKGKIKASAPILAKTEEQARRKAERIAARKAGVVAFSRTGDADFGDYDDPVIIAQLGQVPREAGSF